MKKSFCDICDALITRHPLQTFVTLVIPAEKNYQHPYGIAIRFVPRFEKVAYGTPIPQGEPELCEKCYREQVEQAMEQWKEYYLPAEFREND